MHYDAIRKQIDKAVASGIASGVDVREAYQAVLDAAADYRERLEEIEHYLDHLEVPQLGWPDSDEEGLCDE